MTTAREVAELFRIASRDCRLAHEQLRETASDTARVLCDTFAPLDSAGGDSIREAAGLLLATRRQLLDLSMLLDAAAHKIDPPQ